ncbi:glutathione S-transferase [Azospirillum doebereinerae]|uniref:glutathione transferase n=1 Tax=Azospirillum doebereinerae TaxID=92933 RepID=A0A433J7A9_9PROT|nr:glutathione S-transferase [Azospirillum doebereinerae]RUQ69284.1 glutathione S-transferase [Azospirillum doebereinerae]
MITVHHLNNSRSQRVLWLLEELELPYEVVRYERDPATMAAPASLRAVHPLGKSPVVVDDGLTIAESGAILEYIVGQHGHGRLRPAPGTAERLRCTYWLHYAEGSLMPLLLLKLVMDRMGRPPMPFLLRPLARQIGRGVTGVMVTPRLTQHLDFLEESLKNAPWFAGEEFSVADIQMSFPIEAAASRAGLNGSRPWLMAWLERIHARPAYRRALDRGGPYAYA